MITQVASPPAIEQPVSSIDSGISESAPSLSLNCLHCVYLGTTELEGSSGNNGSDRESLSTSTLQSSSPDTATTSASSSVTTSPNINDLERSVDSVIGHMKDVHQSIMHGHVTPSQE